MADFVTPDGGHGIPLRYEDAIKKHEPLTLYESGLVEGLRMYSWMKDGVTYVGTTGTTLGVAVDKALTEVRNLWT